MRAASHTKTRLAVKATSRVLSMWKRQVLVRLEGLAAMAAATSSGERMITVASLARALARRICSAAVRTSFGLINSPEPETIIVSGTVSA